MAAKVFEKSAEETAFLAVLKEVYESEKTALLCCGRTRPFPHAFRKPCMRFF